MSSISPVEIWLIVGVLFIIIEFSTIPGIGFLFLGLGSLTSAVLFYFYPDFVNYQIGIVGIISFLWFAVLWWPLRVFVYGKKGKPTIGKDYFNLIGNQVIVISNEIGHEQTGQVSWSGTVMNARLDSKELQPAKKDEILYVLKVEGNILVCTRQKP